MLYLLHCELYSGGCSEATEIVAAGHYCLPILGRGEV